MKGMRYGIRVVLSVAATLMMAGCIYRHNEDRALKTGDKLPEFSVVMNDGRTVSTSDLQGKKSVIVFFHTGCSDCQRELPHLQRAFEYCRETLPKVVFVCISREQKAADIEVYWDEHRLTLPYSAQTDRRIYHQFASTGIPRIFISDENTVITDAFDAQTAPTAGQITEILDGAK